MNLCLFKLAFYRLTKLKNDTINFIICVFLVCSNSSFASDIDLSYKFNAVTKPESILTGPIGAFQTNLYSGSFGYGYKFDVPPGTNGLQPELSLVYNSHSAGVKAGIVGAGWELPHSYIQRDIEYTRKNINDDSFDLFLSGSKHDLVFTGGEAPYRTKVDTFMKVEACSSITSDDICVSAGNSKAPAMWMARMKSGMIYKFGANNNTRHRVSSTDTRINWTWRWNLTQVKDTNGNTINYTYQPEGQNANGGYQAYYLKQIKYNRDGKRQIDFNYSARSDNYITIDQGSQNRLNKRLTRIDIKINGALERRYQLGYVNNALGTKSLLKTITEYGKNANSPLPATTFNYQSFTKGFNTTPEPDWSNSGNLPIRDVDNDGDTKKDIFDVNGDGLPDRVRFSDGVWKIKMNTGSGFQSSEVYWDVDNRWAIRQVHTPSEDYKDVDIDEQRANTRSSPMDMNRDGYIDFVWANNDKDSDGNENNRVEIRFGNGSGLSGTSSGWNVSADNVVIRRVRKFGDDDPETEQAIFDLNGDGLPDVIKRLNDTTWGVWRNLGSGFAAQENWSVASVSNLSGYLDDLEDEADRDTDIARFDMNGDGLVDIVNARSSTWQIYYNTGSGFVRGPNYIATSDHITDVDGDGDINHDVFDINGDGLPDKVRGGENGVWHVQFNTGKGFTAEQNWSVPSFSDNDVRDIKDDGREVARDSIDINGDGAVDLIRKRSGNWDVYLNKSLKTDLLTSVKESFGGTINVSYRSSREFSNTRLPSNYWLVGSIETNNGLPGDHAVSTKNDYSYSGGLYDYPTREFRGFNTVTEVHRDQKQSGTALARTIHHFRQGHASEGANSQAWKGKEYKTELKNGSGSVRFAEEYKVWSKSRPYSGVYESVLKLSENKVYDGLNSAKANRTDFLHHDRFGNPTVELQKGDINTTTDDLQLNTEYVYNLSKWIVGKLSREIQKNHAGQRMRETRYFYDYGYLSATPKKGNLTAVEQVSTTGINSSTEYYYDEYGNQTKVIDANGNATSTAFDSGYHTFPIRITNAKGHISHATYNPVNGQPLSQTDVNSNTTQFAYDNHHRLSKTIRPGDSVSLPTEQNVYTITATAPQWVKISKREISGQSGTLDSYQFVDGFGNMFQAKTESEVPGQAIVVSHYYDALGRVTKKSYPFSGASGSVFLNTPKSSKSGDSYQYDALGRPIKIIRSDGAQRTRNFQHWKVTESDENGHQKVYTFDSKQRPLLVQENNSGQIYSTTYKYNAVGELLSLTDHAQNITTIQYDDLGRKMLQNDPDMGVWRYKYDQVGNVVEQTDARGISTRFYYDELNRKRLEAYPNDPNVGYVYDEPEELGLLSKVYDNAGLLEFDYDNRNRKTSEVRSTLDCPDDPLVDCSDSQYTRTWESEWVYDAMDRITRETHPNNEVVDYIYNGQGLLDSVPGLITELDYNVSGQLTSKVLADTDSTITTYSYDSRQRLESLITPQHQNFTYEYDAVGNVKKITDDGQAETFTYDSLDRLKTANADEFDRDYAYSAIGNMTSLDREGEAESQAFGQSAGPHALTSIDSGAPHVNSFQLEDGKPYTADSTVTLDFEATENANEYLASEYPAFIGGTWQAVGSQMVFTLTEQFGNKTVYLKVRNAGGSESNVVQASIDYLQNSDDDDIPDIFDLDDDNDGIPDWWEIKYGLNPFDDTDAGLDSDQGGDYCLSGGTGDGATNLQEFQHGSDPTLCDTDEDYWNDGKEINEEHTNPADPDTDDDGIIDSEDKYPLSPFQDANSKNYGIAQGHITASIGDFSFAGSRIRGEVNNGLVVTTGLIKKACLLREIKDSDPIEYTEHCDHDGDGVFDDLDEFEENADEWRDSDDDGEGNNEDQDDDNDGISDADDPDDDNDGISDDYEMQNGMDPNNPGDAGQDFDEDGLTNLEEFELCQAFSAYDICPDPNEADTDTDEDGIPDIADSDPEDAANTGKAIILSLDNLATEHFGNNHGSNSHQSVISFLFASDGLDDRLFHIRGFDVVSDNELSVYVNDKFLGQMSVSVAGDHNLDSVWWFTSDFLVEGLNRVTIRQSLEDDVWGITRVGLFETNKIFGNMTSEIGFGHHTNGFELHYIGSEDRLIGISSLESDPAVSDEINIDLNGDLLGKIDSEQTSVWNRNRYLFTPRELLEANNNKLLFTNDNNPQSEWGVRFESMNLITAELGNVNGNSSDGENPVTILFPQRNETRGINFDFLGVNSALEIEIFVDGSPFAFADYDSSVPINSWAPNSPLYVEPSGSNRLLDITLEDNFPGTLIWGVRIQAWFEDRDKDGVADEDDAFPDNPDEWLDTDKDGIGNNQDSDDDDDGFSDQWEIDNGFDPLVPNSGDDDPDGDGLTNAEEQALGTHPLIANLDVFASENFAVIQGHFNASIGKLQSNNKHIISEIGNGLVHFVQNLNLTNDTDGDGVPDTEDAFPDDPNEWVDTDGDGVGNNADPDDDNDNTLDQVDCSSLDNQKWQLLSGYSDVDNDGFGAGSSKEICTGSVLPNGYADVGTDNCPNTTNLDQLDTDSDSLGDICDSDKDNDGIADTDDSDDLNPRICRDDDLDSCDDCSVGEDQFGPLADYFPDNDGEDTDGNGVCNLSDDDDDNDGVLDLDDNCPVTSNPDQKDSNDDGIGDVCESEDCDFFVIKGKNGNSVIICL